MPPALPSILVRGPNHPEGVAWSPDLGVLVCGGEGGELYVVDCDDGSCERVAATGGSLLGVTCDGRGGVYACDISRGAVLLIELASGHAEVVAGGLEHPNFTAFDQVGNLWLSDSGTWGRDDGRILVLAPSGALRTVSRAVPAFTNGLAVSPDGSWLYAVESAAARVMRLRLGEAATLGPAEHVAALPGTVPDGLAFAAAGDLLVSCYRPDAVLRLTPNGAETIAEDPQGVVLAAATNLAFFGARLERLVVANLQGRHLTEIAAPGAGLPLHYTPSTTPLGKVT